MRGPCALLIGLILAANVAAQRRLVLIDQDGSGPGGANQMSTMVLLQSPNVDVLGITIVTGDAWRDEEVLHTLRMLELAGRSEVPVVPGAVFPLVRTEAETRLMFPLHGTPVWLGAWGKYSADVPLPAGSAVPAQFKSGGTHSPYEIPAMPEGSPATRPLDEDAAHFLVRQVRAHPGEVTIYAGGPLTNIAIATSIEPRFAEMTRGIVIMGGSLNPQTDDPEFATSPRHEFNFWFDPEAAHIVLRAAWPHIEVTTVDVSIKAMFTEQMLAEISKSPHPAARYIAKYSDKRFYLWDEIAACAWLDPSIITRRREIYMDVDISHGPSYGFTLSWLDQIRPRTGVRVVAAQVDLDLEKFTRMFVGLMSAPPRDSARQR
jgi:purine nucleosidase